MSIARQDFAIQGNGRVLSVFTVTGRQTGPTVALVGGIHGDEMEGPLVLSGILTEIDFDRLAGTLLVVPVANAEAVAAYTRCSPSDGLNLARCFPGDTAGSATQQVAALITEHAISRANYLVDLHSGGIGLDAAFFAGYTSSDGMLGQRSRDMALAFGAPVVWRHDPPLPPGRTLSAAEALGIPAIYVEAGGGTYPPAAILDGYRAGVLRVLHHLKMYDAPQPEMALPLRVEGSGDLDNALAAPVTGICTCHIEPLQQVEPGTLCFTIADLDGTSLGTVHSTTSGYAMFTRRNRWVEQGELLMAIAQPDRS